ncbi:MAG: dynamin family protein [Bradymonadaceae bacterium]|nr:dynamin family protein [Lujinxingiaceae bacterium]
MSLFDKLSERVGDFLGEVLLPEDIRSSHERASQAIKRQDYGAALNILDAADRMRPGVERTRHMMGLCYFYRGEFDRSVALFREAIALREEASSHFYVALALEKQRRFHDAQVHLQRAIAISGQSALEFDLHFGLGRIFLAQRRADKAIKELRKALRIWPDQSEAAVTLAEALLEREQFVEAREIMATAADKASSKHALLVTARIEEACANAGAARAAYEGVLSLDGQDASALIGAARNCLATSDHARANEYLLRALEASSGGERVDVFVLLGRVNETVANYPKALSFYQTALAADQGHLEAVLGAGRMSLLLGEVHEAAGHFAAVLSSGDGRHTREALLGLGRCRLAQEDFAGARHLLEEADQHAQLRDADVLHALGQVALGSGDAAEAVVALREALHVGGNSDRSQAIRADLHEALVRLRPRWKLPENFDNPVDVMAALVQLREHASQNPRLGRFLTPIHALIARMDAPLAIAIVGEFNAGKSTLVNAILGEEVVPMGVLPTTAHPCIMQYGPRKATRVAYHDGRSVEVGFEEATRLMKAEADQIERLDYLYPHPELRSVHFWDTPGFNALDERHEEAALWALEHGEAILWVLDANQVLSHTEFERIEALPAGNERLIVLINKIDRLGSGNKRAEQLEQLVEYVEDNAGDHLIGCFAISALEALNARKRGEQPDEASGFEAFWKFLDARFIQRSGRIKTLEVGRQLGLLVEELDGFGGEMVARFSRLGESASDIRRWITEEAGERPVARAQKEASELSDRIDFVITGVEREVAEALKPRGTWSTKMVLGEEDRAFVLELLKERLQGVLDRSRRTVQNEISVLESELAERVGPILSDLSLQNQRAMNRRLEGFYDETRLLKVLLTERVYGQLAAQARGQIDAGGVATLREIEESPEGDRARRKALLRELVPEPRLLFRQALSGWMEEFFLAATRFCDRLQRDLALLELEATYRYDFSELRRLGSDSERADS